MTSVPTSGSSSGVRPAGPARPGASRPRMRRPGRRTSGEVRGPRSNSTGAQMVGAVGTGNAWADRGISLQPSELRRFVTLTETEVLASGCRQPVRPRRDAGQAAAAGAAVDRRPGRRRHGHGIRRRAILPIPGFTRLMTGQRRRLSCRRGTNWCRHPCSPTASRGTSGSSGPSTSMLRCSGAVALELYLIAENTATGMLTWVIVDYESDTINYGPGEGFTGATTDRSVITTTHAGDVLVMFQQAPPEPVERDGGSARCTNARTRPAALGRREPLGGLRRQDDGGRVCFPSA